MVCTRFYSHSHRGVIEVLNLKQQVKRQFLLLVLTKQRFDIMDKFGFNLNLQDGILKVNEEDLLTSTSSDSLVRKISVRKTITLPG